MTERPSVKIVVSCHKPFPIPDSDVYLPVQVGAINAAAIPGMQPDDEGENISERNFTFCELSAQYWAWKNLNADYVGQCHYRRYFCFGEAMGECDDHAQIVVPHLTNETAHQLALDDSALISQEVQRADITTAHWWDVRGVKTPRGASRNVAEHMTSYGLYSYDDLEVLKQVVRDRRPEYFDDLEAYLAGDRYLGYNCFVMRRAAFEELCSFEFDVLLEFDSRKDYDGLTRNQRRICGYLGEVLYSTFIQHVTRLKSYSIQERPLVFFDAVTPGLKIVDRHEDAATTQIIWNATGLFFPDNWSADQCETMSYVLPVSLAVSLRSLFDAVDPKLTYHISIIVRPKFLFGRFWNAIGKVPKNVTIDLVTWVPTESAVVQALGSDVLVDNLPALLPWAFAGTDAKVIWIDGLFVFRNDPHELLSGCGVTAGIAAMCGIRLQKELGKPGSFGDVDRSWRQSIKRYADSRIAVVDLGASRARWSLDEVLDVMNRPGFGQFLLGPRGESFSADVLLSSLGVSLLPFSLAYPSLHIEDTQGWASAEALSDWERAEKKGAILIEDCPIPSTNVDFSCNEAWWEVARTTRGYENLLMHASADFALATQIRLRDKLLPKGSKRRQFAGRVIRVIKDTLR